MARWNYSKMMRGFKVEFDCMVGRLERKEEKSSERGREIGYLRGLDGRSERRKVGIRKAVSLGQIL